MKIAYKTIEKIAAVCDVRTERGKDEDGPYISLHGFLANVQEVERQLPAGHVAEHASTGYYVRRWTER